MLPLSLFFFSLFACLEKDYFYSGKFLPKEKLKFCREHTTGRGWGGFTGDTCLKYETIIFDVSLNRGGEGRRYHPVGILMKGFLRFWDLKVASLIIRFLILVTPLSSLFSIIFKMCFHFEQISFDDRARNLSSPPPKNIQS